MRRPTPFPIDRFGLRLDSPPPLGKVAAKRAEGAASPLPTSLPTPARCARSPTSSAQGKAARPFHSAAIGIVGLSLGAILLSACAPSDEAHEPPPIRPVLITVAERTATRMFGPFAGTVEPRYQSQLGFQIGGRVAARDVTIGDVVKKGQRLASLDPVVTRFALTRAEADVADAKAQAENAAATEARQRRLMEGGNVTQAQLDSSTAGRDTTQARLAQAMSSLQRARDQMGYTELHADFDGVVTQRLAEVGQVLSAGQAVVTVARPEVREAVVDIPEDLVGTMPRDGRFTISLQSAPEITTVGTVREVAPFADTSTRTRRIKLTLIDPPSAFRLGATITVALAREIEPHVVLPPTALLEAEGKTSVWIVPQADKGSVLHVERRSVDVARHDADHVSLRDGVRDGERVVIAGVHSLSDGQPVRIDESAP